MSEFCLCNLSVPAHVR